MRLIPHQSISNVFRIFFAIFIIVIMISAPFYVNSISTNSSENNSSSMQSNLRLLESKLQEQQSSESPQSAPQYRLVNTKVTTSNNQNEQESEKISSNSVAKTDQDNNKISDDLDSDIEENNDQSQTHTQSTQSNSEDVMVLTDTHEIEGDVKLFNSLGGKISNIWDNQSDIVNGFAGSISLDKIETFSKQANHVKIIHKEHKVELHSNEINDMFNTPSIWNDLGYNGDDNMSVAVIDGGIDDTHPSFSPGYNGEKNWSSKIIGWEDFSDDNEQSPVDYIGHGTHVSGIAGSNLYNSTTSDGRLATTWARSHDGANEEGEFVYPIHIDKTGTIDLNYVWDFTTSGSSSAKGTYVQLYNPAGELVAENTTENSNMTVSHSVQSSSDFGDWEVRLGYEHIGGKTTTIYATGVQKMPHNFTSSAPFGGIAPNIKLVSLKVFSNDGTGYASDIVDALNWVKNNKEDYHITATSMSFSIIDGNGDPTISSTVDSAVSSLIKSGVLVVVAAGNEYMKDKSIGSPAHVDGTIAVGASTNTNDISAYTSKGPGLGSNVSKPDIVAPGNGIINADTNYGDLSNNIDDSYNDDYSYKSGTSMSTPVVAGTAALLMDAMGGHSEWEYGSTTSPFTIKQYLLMTSNEIWIDNRGQKDYIEGYGRINPRVAIDTFLNSYSIGSQESYTLGSHHKDQSVWGRSVTLNSGTTYTFQLDVPSDVDFDLFLYEPDYDQYGDPVLADSSVNYQNGTDEYISIDPSTSGEYFIVIKTSATNSGAGEFTLTSTSSNNHPAISITSPTSQTVISGQTTIDMSTSDPDGTDDIDNVQVRIADHVWVNASDIGSGNYEYSFNSTVLPDGNYTITVRAIDSTGHSSYNQTNISTDNYNAPILLVDDDDNENYEIYYMNVLESMGYIEGINYDLWTHYSQGTPSSNTMSDYQLVMWFTSDDYTTTLESADQTELSTYLDNGGNLWISGQDIGYDIGGSSFYNNYLHANFDSDDVGTYSIYGNQSDFLGGHLYEMGSSSDPGSGSGVNNFPSDISAGSGAQEILYYGNDTSLGAGIKYSGNHKVVYLSFNWEAMYTIYDKSDNLNQTFEWFNLNETQPIFEDPQDNEAIQVNDTLTWTDAENAIKYYIFRDGKYLGYTSTNSFDVTNQPSGWHTYNIIAEYGNRIAGNGYDLFVDDINPTITSPSPLNGSVLQSGTSISFSVSDNFDIGQVKYNWDDSSNQTLSSPYEVQLPAGDGTHDLNIFAYDTAGNPQQITYSFVTDDTIPDISLVNPNENDVLQSGSTIDLNVSDLHLDTVLYHWDSNSNSTLSSPYDVSLPTGEDDHTLYVYINDSAGNWVSAEYTFTTDDTVPTIVLNSPGEGSTLQSGSTIDLSASDIHLDTVLYHWDSDSNSTLSSPYDVSLISGDGNHTLYVYGNDSAGNWASAEYTFTTDDTSPSVTIEYPSVGGVYQSGETIKANISDILSNVDYIQYHWDSDPYTQWSSPYETTLPSGDGDHILYIWANDTIGNWGEFTFSFTTDDTAPTISLEDPKNDTIVSSGATVDTNITDAYLDTVLYNWDNTANSTWTPEYTTEVPDSGGDHILRIYANDTAGNLKFKKYLFTVDENLPKIKLVQPAVNRTALVSNSSIKVNITDSDSNLDTLLYNWDQSNNDTWSNSNDIHETWLPNATYEGEIFNLHIYVNDTSGNSVYYVYEFYGDDLVPRETLESPKVNGVYQSNTKVDVDINESFIDLVWYNWDNGENNSFSSPYETFLPGGDGNHTLYVYANDTVGHLISVSYTFTTDDKLPTIVLNTPVNGSTLQSGSTIDLSASDIHLDTVLYHWDSDSNSTLTSPYNVTLPSGDGDHILYMYGNDSAGNWQSVEFTFTTDDTSPSLQLTDPQENDVLQSGSTIDLSASDLHLDTVLYHWDSDSNSTLTSPYNVTLPSGDGDHTLYMYGNDSAGNWQSVEFTFTTDDTTPSIVLNSPDEGSILQSNSTIDLFASDNIHLDTVLYHWDSDSNSTLTSPYNVSLPSGDGNHTLYVYGNDSAGNWYNKTFEFVSDDTSPSLSSPNDLAYDQFSTGNSVTWNISDSRPWLYNITIDDGIIIQEETWSNGSLEINIDGYGIGNHTIQITLIDQANNTNTDTVNFEVHDTIFPTLSTVRDVRIGDDTNYSLTWNISDYNPSHYNLLINDTYELLNQSWSNGTITFNLLSLDIGDYIIELEAHDLGGNVVNDTVIVMITSPSAPQVSTPQDFSYAEGSTGNTIQWNVADSDPDVYNISMNSSIYQDYENNRWSNGSITIDIDNLQLGSYVFEISISDTLGNVITDRVIISVVDETPAQISTSVVQGSILNSNSSIDITIFENYPDIVLFNWDGNDNTTLTSNFNFSTILPSGEGEHTLYIYANDTSGNWAIKTYDFITDDISPTVTLNSPRNGSTISPGSAIILEINDANLDLVLFNWNGTTNQTTSSEPNNIYVPLEEGTYILNLYAKDYANNWQYQEYVFFSNSTQSPVVLESPTDDIVQQSESEIVFDINTTNISEIKYNWDGKANVTFSGSKYNTSVPIGDGIHTITIYTKSSGEWSSYQFNFITDDTNPDLSINLSNNEYYKSGTILDFTISEKNIKSVIYKWAHESDNQTLSYPYALQLPSGDDLRAISIWIIDRAGNSISDDYFFNIDDTSPDINLINDNGDMVFMGGSDISFNITDSKELDSVVYWWNNNNKNHTLNDPFNISLPLVEGEWNLTIVAYDSAINYIKVKYTFIIDNTAPYVNLISPTPGDTYRSNTTIKINGTDPNFDKFVFHWDQETNQTIMNTSLRAHLPSGDGKHILNIFVYDLAGNVNVKSYTFTVDDSVPVISLYKIREGLYTGNTSIWLNISSSKLDQTLFNWNDTLNQTLSSPYHIQMPTKDGVYFLYVYANNSDGIWTQAMFEFEIDSTRPTISIENPYGTYHQGSTNITLNITDVHLLSVLYNWDDAPFNSTLSEPYVVSLPDAEGAHSLTIYATDKAGNSIKKIFELITDNTVPEISLVSPNNNSTHITGGEAVQLKIFDQYSLLSAFYHWNNSNENSTWQISENDIYETDIPISQGLHVLKVYGLDRAGNIISAEYQFTVLGSNSDTGETSSSTSTSESDTEPVDEITGSNFIFFVWGTVIILAAGTYIVRRRLKS